MVIVVEVDERLLVADEEARRAVAQSFVRLGKGEADPPHRGERASAGSIIGSRAGMFAPPRQTPVCVKISRATVLGNLDANEEFGGAGGIRSLSSGRSVRVVLRSRRRRLRRLRRRHPRDRRPPPASGGRTRPAARATGRAGCRLRGRGIVCHTRSGVHGRSMWRTPRWASGVDHRVLHRRGGADRGGLADALGAERVERRRGLGRVHLERRQLGRRRGCA